MFRRAVKCCQSYACQHRSGTPVNSRGYIINQWSQMGLHPALEQRLYDVKFAQPTPIQARVRQITCFCPPPVL